MIIFQLFYDKKNVKNIFNHEQSVTAGFRMVTRENASLLKRTLWPSSNKSYFKAK